MLNRWIQQQEAYDKGFDLLEELCSGEGATGRRTQAIDALHDEHSVDTSTQKTATTTTSSLELEDSEGESDVEDIIEPEKEKKRKYIVGRKVEKKEDKGKFYQGKRKRKSSADVLAATFERMSEEANLRLQALLSAKRSRIEESIMARVAKILSSEHYSK